eukprot:CAMPEP_0198653112 /NCGR_PEP_ID=MMETSP1467-20131203/6840_1 /TAXON_ID=1462469 /ORGANISM="unid. sp., Strain CCMP2135" /LENGTH=64 /DNA_ID=CAMNT_0044389063 /DNA_START=44 /DNA_END=238 /DNA_ORIENTATION=-
MPKSQKTKTRKSERRKGPSQVAEARGTLHEEGHPRPKSPEPGTRRGVPTVTSTSAGAETEEQRR